MSHFSKEELSFANELPEHVEIECPVCLDILTDPHLVSCCGHNFCGSCIERVKVSNGSCPMCKEEEYQAIPDKKCLRIINGLEVYCSNKKKGCQWKGELKNMSTHLNKTKRKGECQYESVKCQYKKCQERKQRRYLKNHEDKDCPQRPFKCQYCRSKGTFLSITKDHYEECSQYPVTCPNKCVSTNMLQGSLTAHINECPLQPVDCVFSWAGCNDKPLRKDVHVHTADTKHMIPLAIACEQLKEENEQIKEENEQIKEETTKEVQELKIEKDKMETEMTKQVQMLKEENTHLKYHLHHTIPGHPYPLLPIHIRYGSEFHRVTQYINDLAQLEAPVHFYTVTCGRHMSAKIMKGTSSGEWLRLADLYVLLAFHEGKFDRLQINTKLPTIFADFEGTTTPLIEDTEATYVQMPHDILNRISSHFDAGVPHGVIKIKIGSMSDPFILSNPAVIYTK